MGTTQIGNKRKREKPGKGLIEFRMERYVRVGDDAVGEVVLGTGGVAKRNWEVGWGQVRW